MPFSRTGKIYPVLLGFASFNQSLVSHWSHINEVENENSSAFTSTFTKCPYFAFCSRAIKSSSMKITQFQARINLLILFII